MYQCSLQYDFVVPPINKYGLFATFDSGLALWLVLEGDYDRNDSVPVLWKGLRTSYVIPLAPWEQA